MSSSSLPLFKGINWEECESFIRVIRARALQEGKQRDAAWIADFAGPLFSRKALSWHCRLPQDVRQDWFKLETALLDRWCIPDDEEDSHLEPTPAAAPSVNLRRPLDGLHNLKVVSAGSNTNYFVELADDAKVGSLTTRASDALRVRCFTSPNSTLMERDSVSYRSWITVQWEQDSKDRPARFAFLSFVKFNTLKSSWSYETPWQLLRCNVSANGQVIPTWEKDGTEVTLDCFFNESTLHLTEDSNTYSKAYPQNQRAKIFVELVN